MKLKPEETRKRWLLPAMIVLGMIAVGLSPLPGLAKKLCDCNKQEFYRVQGAAEPVPMYTRPATDASIVTRVPTGARCLAGHGKSQKNGSIVWTYVTFKHNTGWVQDQYLAADSGC